GRGPGDEHPAGRGTAAGRRGGDRRGRARPRPRRGRRRM
ncbi:MAG: hypothetical protein AVDCRST_MAG48-3787, partial [uncultured Friedmanniella sp.]